MDPKPLSEMPDFVWIILTIFFIVVLALYILLPFFILRIRKELIEIKELMQAIKGVETKAKYPLDKDPR